MESTKLDNPPSTHLLRTMGAVPPGQRVLVLEDPAGQHANPLARLGFDVHLCEQDAESGISDSVQVVAPSIEELTYSEEHFAWIVMHGVAVEGTPDALIQRCKHLRRLLRSGGWLYAALPARPLNAMFEAESHSAEGLRSLMDRAELVVAERPILTEVNGELVARGIFRRVDERTTP